MPPEGFALLSVLKRFDHASLLILSYHLQFMISVILSAIGDMIITLSFISQYNIFYLL